jgi:hypothetical protein
MQHFILDKVISQTKHPLNKFWMNMPIIEYIACRPSIYVDWKGLYRRKCLVCLYLLVGYVWLYIPLESEAHSEASHSSMWLLRS